MFVFERTQAAAWIETAKLAASDGAPGDLLGMWVDVSRDVIVAGAPAADGDLPGEGAAYVFERGPGAGPRSKSSSRRTRSRTTHSDGPSPSTAKRCPSPRSSRPLPLALDRCTSCGDPPGGWEPIAKLRSADGAIEDAFGNAVALDGSTAFIGALWDDDHGSMSGSAYVFDIPVLATPYGFCTANGPCGNTTFYAGCANSTGEGAGLGACGSTSVLADDLALTVTGLPPGVPAILFRGSGGVRAPFGDGVLLIDVSGGSRRYPTLFPNIGGTATWGPAVFGASGIQAGETWWFQVWYADPGGPCGSGANLSSGLRVSFDL